MSKKDIGNIAKTIEKMTSTKPVVRNENETFSYVMPVLEKLYNLVQPYQQTVENTNLVYLNSNEDISDNAYWIKLSDIYSNQSSTFASLVDLRRNMLHGNGLVPAVPETDPLYIPTLDFINKENEYGENLQDIWFKLCFDYSLMETYFLELLYSQDGKIASTIHTQPNKVRASANPENPHLEIVSHWELSNVWGRTNKGGKYRNPANKGIVVADFNPKSWASDGGRQILNCKRYTSSGGFYTIPSHNSILPYAELQYQLAEYSLSTVSKNFTPQCIVMLSGAPDKKAKDEFINKFKARYSGANGERILFLWGTGDDNKAEILPFNTVDSTPLLEALNKLSVESIARGFGAPSELVNAGGGVSLQTDANRLIASYNYYLQSKITPMLMEMLKTLNKIFIHNELAQVRVDVNKLTSEAISPVEGVENQPVNNVKNLMQ